MKAIWNLLNWPGVHHLAMLDTICAAGELTAVGRLARYKVRHLQNKSGRLSVVNISIVFINEYGQFVSICFFVYFESNALILVLFCIMISQ